MSKPHALPFLEVLRFESTMAAYRFVDFPWTKSHPQMCWGLSLNSNCVPMVWMVINLIVGVRGSYSHYKDSRIPYWRWDVRDDCPIAHIEKDLAAAGTFEDDGKVFPKRWDIDPFPGRITCITYIYIILLVSPVLEKYLCSSFVFFFKDSCFTRFIRPSTSEVAS